jgi:hypothetical protein
MNHPVDMHPEDLLDREQYGLLSSEEQRRLDEHCVQCSACAVVRKVTRDFVRERQVNSADPVMLDRLVEAALESFAPTSARHAAVAFVPRRRRKPWAVAAVVMFAATGAAASFLSVRRDVVERFVPMMRVVHEPRLLPASMPIAKKAVAAPAPVEPVPERIVPSLPLSLNIRVPAPREPVAAPVKPKAVEAATPTVTADQLYKALTDAQHRHDTSQAMQLYRRLQRQFPGSPEEATSTYTVGRLLYDSGEDTSEALDLFNRYLAESPNGTLAEEARVGRALALQRMGRSSEERQAWLDLLSAHPRSVHADRARRRLEQLR